MLMPITNSAGQFFSVTVNWLMHNCFARVRNYTEWRRRWWYLWWWCWKLGIFTAFDSF